MSDLPKPDLNMSSGVVEYRRAPLKNELNW